MAIVLAWGNSKAIGAGNVEDGNFTYPHAVQSLQGCNICGISSGENHTLVCLTNGTVCSAGGNDVTLCGRDRNLSRFEPVTRGLKNKKRKTDHITEVAVGSYHNVIVTEHHKVLTWGQNSLGQLGRGSVPEQELGIPRLVESLSKHNVLQVACGNSHTIVFTDKSLVGVWGSNEYGQLGLGRNVGAFKHNPDFVSCLKGIPVAQVAAGGNHSFILSKSGTIYGWGKNSFGQLGVSNTEDHYVPIQCKQLRRKEVKHICCGDNHTVCLTASGQVFAFGAGSYGQLGNDNHSNSLSSPLKTLDLSALEVPGAEVTQIACGRNHTLVYVSQSDSLYAFGLGGSGQLGLSNTESKNSPILVPGLFPSGENQRNLIIKKIHAGGNNSFVIAEGANTCQPEDLRRENEAKQILILSENKIKLLFSSRDPSKSLLSELKEIFSHASCLNGSFLLQENHPDYRSKKHGVDIKAVQAFFTHLQSFPSLSIVPAIDAGISKLIPKLSSSPPDTEALRLYLILPEFHLFDQPGRYNSIICPFARSFLSLSEMAQKNLGVWWSLEDSSLFKRLVMIYKGCVDYILQLLKSADKHKLCRMNEGLIISMQMLKRLHKINEDQNQIIPYQDFYVETLSKEIKKVQNNEQNMAGNGTQPVFWDYLCLYDAGAKSILLQMDSTMQMVNVMAEDQLQALVEMISGTRILTEHPFDPLRLILKLHISRENVLEDTFSQLREKKAEPKDLKKPLRVSFEGEEGIDEGGPRQEFFTLLFEETVKPENGFFQEMEDCHVLWFSSLAENEERLEKYCLIGILCGMAIYNKILLNLPLPLVFYKKLLDKRLSIDDLKEVMPDVYRGLCQLQEEQEDNPDGIYGFTFEQCGSDDGDRPVTQENKQEFIDLMVDLKLNKSVQNVFNAFKEGFCTVCNKLVFESLHPEELQTLLLGDENYDFKILEESTRYAGEYNKNHPTIRFFWDVIHHEMTLADQKNFLRFYRGSDRIPATGMQSIQMTILPYERDQMLMPEVSTCYNQLKLPIYTDKEKLKERLLLALHAKTFDRA